MGARRQHCCVPTRQRLSVAMALVRSGNELVDRRLTATSRSAPQRRSEVSVQPIGQGDRRQAEMRCSRTAAGISGVCQGRARAGLSRTPSTTRPMTRAAPDREAESSTRPTIPHGMAFGPDGQPQQLESSMDTIPPRSAGEGATSDVWGDLAKLPAQVVARDYPQQWVNSGLPGSLAALDTLLETVWAAIQLGSGRRGPARSRQHATAQRRDREPHDHRYCQQLQQAAVQGPPARCPDQWPASRRGRRWDPQQARQRRQLPRPAACPA